MTKPDRLLAALWVLLGLTTALSLFWGDFDLVASDYLQPGSSTYTVLWLLRLPRILIAFGAGAGLAIAGLVFQTLFANTLATPYTLGVSSGASFGAVFVLFLAGSGNWGFGWFVPIGAWSGALVATGLVGVAAKHGLARQKHAMLLAGVAVTFFFSSLILLLQALSSHAQVFHMLRWLMGGVSVVGYSMVYLLAATLFGCWFWLQRHTRALNVMLLGDDLAQSKGLGVSQLRLRSFLVVSVLVGAIVSTVGPIGFIGLVVPHAVRLFCGQDHKRLLPRCALLGGLVLMFCDWIGRTLFAPQELPVGVITAVLGSPAFFVLLMRRQPIP